jgi:hypothetical protein
MTEGGRTSKIHVAFRARDEYCHAVFGCLDNRFDHLRNEKDAAGGMDRFAATVLKPLEFLA